MDDSFGFGAKQDGQAGVVTGGAAARRRWDKQQAVVELQNLPKPATSSDDVLNDAESGLPKQSPRVVVFDDDDDDADDDADDDDRGQDKQNKKEECDSDEDDI